MEGVDTLAEAGGVAEIIQSDSEPALPSVSAPQQPAPTAITGNPLLRTIEEAKPEPKSVETPAERKWRRECEATDPRRNAEAHDEINAQFRANNPVTGGTF
jgi:hypothetical protein